MSRKTYFDGLRGIACVMVVLSHIAQLFFPYLIYGDDQLIHGQWESVFTRFPFTIVYNGNSGVFIFLIIGGFLSVGIGRNISSIYAFLRRCIKRYLRLLIPIAITSLIAVLLINANCFLYNQLDAYTLNKAIITPSGSIGLFDYIKYITYSVFFDATEFGKTTLSYNHVLWTIRIEFVSSIIVYSICAFVKNNKMRIGVFVLIIGYLIANNQILYCSFFVGSILAELDSCNIQIDNSIGQVVLVLLGLFCLGYPYVLKDNIYKVIGNFYGPNIHVGDCGSVLHLLGAASVLIAILNSSKVQKALSNKVLVKIGGVSLYIYMLHWTLLLSLVPALIMMFPKTVDYNVVILVCCMIFGIVCGIMSALLSVFDKKVITIKLKKYLD